jgi:hypothetical protein
MVEVTGQRRNSSVQDNLFYAIFLHILADFAHYPDNW